MNQTVNDSSKLCPEIRVNDLYLFESLLILLLASIAFIVISMKMRIIWRSGGATPVNVKLLFLGALTTSIFRSIQFLLTFFYYILLFADQRAVVPFNLNLCIAQQFFYVMPAQVDFCLLFLIAIERMWTTFRLEPEKYSSKPWLYGLICIIVTWVFSTAQFVYYVFSNGVFAPEPKLICFCYINVLWPARFLTSNPLAMIALQAATCSAYAFVYLKNSSKLSQFGINRAQQTLAQRFTIWSNIRATKWLIPITLFNSLVGCLLMLMVDLGRKFFSGGFTPGYLCYLHLCFIIFCIQDATVPLLALRYNSTLQKTARDLYPNIFNFSLVKKFFSIHNDQEQIHVLNQQPPLAINPQNFGDQVDKVSQGHIATTEAGAVRRSVIVSEKTTVIVNHNKPKILNERRKIFDYRVHPADYNDILSDVWNKR